MTPIECVGGKDLKKNILLIGNSDLRKAKEKQAWCDTQFIFLKEIS